MTPEKVTEETPDRAYFTMIPNIVDEKGLDVYAFRLYVHYKRRCGAEPGGECWESTRNIGRVCNMSQTSAIKAKRELEAAGLITVRKTEPDDYGRVHDIVTVRDIWKENTDYFYFQKTQKLQAGGAVDSEPKETKELEDTEGEYQGGSASPAGDWDFPTKIKAFPEDIRETIGNVCALWMLDPPQEQEGGGGRFAMWVKHGRELKRACGEFGPDMILSIYEYMQTQEPIRVNGPGALMNIAVGVAGNIRAGGFTPTWPEIEKKLERQELEQARLRDGAGPIA